MLINFFYSISHMQKPCHDIFRLIAHRRISRKAHLHTIDIIKNGNDRNHDKKRLPADFIFPNNIAHNAEPDECGQPQKCSDVICCCHLPVSGQYRTYPSGQSTCRAGKPTEYHKRTNRAKHNLCHTAIHEQHKQCPSPKIEIFCYSLTYPLQSFHAFRSSSSWKYDFPHPQKQLSVCAVLLPPVSSVHST